MKKTTIVLIGIAILGGIISLTVMFLGMQRSAPDSSNVQAPTFENQSSGSGSAGATSGTAGIPAGVGKTVTIRGAEGAVLNVSDFMNDPQTTADPINKGYYYLGYNPIEGISSTSAPASVNPPFIIEYIASTQYFDIGLMQEPLSQTRQEVEQYLMTHLGITQEQLCQLNYMLSVPYSVNQFYAGESLGFSGCPGAVDLP